MSMFPTTKAALLGRPNVGKSTLFNRLIRSNRAITHDRPGVTRDRMEGFVRRRNEETFGLIDTGGVHLDHHAQVEEGPAGIKGFEAAILKQAKEAAEESSLLCLVVDAIDGLTPFDQHLADFLRKYNKPLILIVNKVDGPERADLLSTEFYSLGLPVIPCSAAHGYNVRQLESVMRDLLFSESALPELDLSGLPINLEGATHRQKKELQNFYLQNAENPIASGQAGDESEVDQPSYDTAENELLETNFPQENADSDEESSFEQPNTMRIALLGRPNAGKSSLINALIGKERMIVSDVAGTTRDSVDVSVMISDVAVTFIDTAGVRRRTKIIDQVERFSVNASLKSTTKADVTILVLDGAEGMTLQDKRLIDLLNERRTPFMVLVNKCDLIAPELKKSAEKQYQQALVFCPHVPLLFVSALKKKNLRRILPQAQEILKECHVRIKTGALNRSMTHVLEKHQPPLVKGARPKFFYMTQAESAPPTFVFFVSDAERILPSYARYIEKSLRQLFEISHAPMRVHFRSTHKKKKK